MDKSETYKILVIFSIILSLFFLKTENRLFLFIELILLLSSIFFFRTVELIISYWRLVTEKIGGIISKITLSLIFFLFLTPLAIIYRIFNRARVHHFYSDYQESYFEDADPHTKSNFHLQW